MRMKLADIDPAAEKLLPPTQPDGSGVGVNYTDAFIKPFNTTLENGTSVTCKRRGLKIMLTIGDQKGEAIMDRINDGPDARDMLNKALASAAKEAGAELTIEDGAVYVEV